jgi:hypothetical protein
LQDGIRIVEEAFFDWMVHRWELASAPAQPDLPANGDPLPLCRPSQRSVLAPDDPF